MKLKTKRTKLFNSIYSVQFQPAEYIQHTITSIYRPKEKLFPFPPALYPKGLVEPKPFPYPEEKPPL